MRPVFEVPVYQVEQRWQSAPGSSNEVTASRAAEVSDRRRGGKFRAPAEHRRVRQEIALTDQERVGMSALTCHEDGRLDAPRARVLSGPRPLTGCDPAWRHLAAAAPARYSITMTATVSALARYHALSYSFASLTLYIRRSERLLSAGRLQAEARRSGGSGVSLSLVFRSLVAGGQLASATIAAASQPASHRWLARAGPPGTVQDPPPCRRARQ